MTEQIRLASIEREYSALRSEVEESVKRVFQSGNFILGPEVSALETELARYLRVRHVVTCANGTDALMIALRACGIGVGDEVIVPAFTFAATAEAVVLVGATPVFADIEFDTFLLDARDVERRITPQTRAVIPVHLFGQCVDWDALVTVTSGRSIRLIEDAAQAIGAENGISRAGSLGHAAAFSFYPTKNLGGPGDGGMLTTNDASIAEIARSLRAHGSNKPYVHHMIGMNSRLDEIQAAVLRVKLPYLDQWNAKRQARAELYRIASEGTGLLMPRNPLKGTHVYHHFAVRTSDRARLAEHLSRHGVGYGIYYPVPLHRQKAFEAWAPNGIRLPNTERVAAEVLSLPIHQWLSDKEVQQIQTCLAAWRESGKPAIAHVPGNSARDALA